MTQLDKGRYLLSIEKIPPKPVDGFEQAKSDSAFCALPAYFVGSTAPNNVEDGVHPVPNPEPVIEDIAKFLITQKQPELLIAIHGYNTALGFFAEEQQRGSGAKGWYQDIRDHIVDRFPNRSPGLMLIGYRWPSEVITGMGNDTLWAKLRYAQRSLSRSLKVVSAVAIALLIGLSLAALIGDLSNSAAFSVIGVIIIVIATMALSVVLTLFMLRIAGYFRDSYRAHHFGVPDLVELIRQLDKAVLAATPDENPLEYWSSSERRIKLSFIGHSMGGFVVTNTVRILSDVFDPSSIGRIDADNSDKIPNPKIGNVFALERLVLVSPDIPAEAIISSRANFLRSSLRRFREAYLFSNEGDMALKLASTAANYASFPARTREGGYRLGNVVVRQPLGKPSPQYGIVNLGLRGGEPKLPDAQHHDGESDDESIKPASVGPEPSQSLKVPAFLSYLYILPRTSLLERQGDVLEVGQRPIAELFTVFDCTDYRESYSGAPDGTVGMLSQALGKRSLSFWNYISLTYTYFTGKIDTHSGYFASADVSGVGPPERRRPEARLTKQLIYGLACLGFGPFLDTLTIADEKDEEDSPSGYSAEHLTELRALSQLCQKHGIQVLLAHERYRRHVFNHHSDRSRY